MLSELERKIVKKAIRSIATGRTFFSCNAISEDSNNPLSEAVRYKYRDFYEQYGTLWNGLGGDQGTKYANDFQRHQRLLMLTLFLEADGEI